MRYLLIYIILACLLTIGYSQNQDTETIISVQAQTGPQMKQVKVKEDYNKDMHSIVKEKKRILPEFQSEKLSVLRDLTKTKTQVKYHSMRDSKPKQILKKNHSPDFGKDRVQYFSRIKTKNKLHRVDGYAPREEITKIEDHPQYDQEILIEALGGVKPIKATTIRKDSSK